MKVEASVLLTNIAPTVIVSHLDKTLTFSISCYRRNRFTADFNVFSQINQYWADQPPEIQQKIFDIYTQIFNAFDDVYTKQSFKEYLQEKVIELLSFHNLESVQEWIAFRSTDIKLPVSIPTEFVADIDRNLSIGKTYIASDYRRLTAFSMVLRCLIPIWGEYIFSIKQNTNDSFKEMLAFQLADKVFNTDVPVVNKLLDYIENSIGPTDAIRPIGIFKGIPTSDYPRWLLALITIHCLSVGDIRGSNPDAHLVTYIHMYISGKLSPKDDLGDSKIKDKEISEEQSDDNQAKASALERYKVKANISIGDVVELEYFLSNILKMANYLAPGIDGIEVMSAIARMKEYGCKPAIPQITLLRWVFKSIVMPSSILYMPELLVKQLMGAAEAVLWHRGHHYLSILLTCHPITSETEMVVSPVDSKMRIPEPLIEQLDKLYPYRRNQNNKRMPSKDTNLAMESIDVLTNNFMTYGWRPISEVGRIEKTLGYRTTRYPIKPDIKTDLARLIIEIQTTQNQSNRI